MANRHPITIVNGALTEIPAGDSLQLTNPAIKGITETVFAVTGTTPALSAANGTLQTWTLTANSTPTNSLNDGQSITLHINDGTAFGVTWTSIVTSAAYCVGGSYPTLATTGYTVIEIWKIGGVTRLAKVGEVT